MQKLDMFGILFCSDKDTDGIEDGNADYHLTRIVCSLAKNLFNEGYCIYVDNWYT